MRKPVLKSVSLYNSLMIKFSAARCPFFSGELCYGAVSVGYVESQIWEATDLL